MRPIQAFVPTTCPQWLGGRGGRSRSLMVSEGDQSTLPRESSLIRLEPKATRLRLAGALMRRLPEALQEADDLGGPSLSRGGLGR